MTHHSDDETRDSRERRLSSAVFRWATGGGRGGQGRVTLCRTPDGLRPLAERGDAGDVYLVPSGHGTLPSGVAPEQVLTFDGTFEEPGDVMHIGSGYEIELRDYLTLPFMAITRPTVVACTTADAWRAFIEDAEEALATGVFIPQLASRSVVLSDRSVIDASIDGTEVAVDRLTIDSAGAVRYRLGGPVVGSTATVDLGDQPAASLLRAEGDAPDAGTALERELAARPWIRRYLAALRIVGGEDGATWTVSGFGAHLASSEHGHGSGRQDTGHLIAWRGDEYRLIAESGRRFQLGRETAVAIECLLQASSRREAVDVARSAGIAPGDLERRLEELRARLGTVGVSIGLSGEGES